MDAGQLQPWSMCQTMTTWLNTRHELDASMQGFNPREKKSRSFENHVISYFQRVRSDCKIESFHSTGTQKRIDCFNADGFWGHCNTVFEAMSCFYQYCHCQETWSALTGEDILLEQKRRKWMKFRCSITRRNITLLSKCRNVNGGNSTRHMYWWRNTWQNLSRTRVYCARTSFWSR